MVRSRSATGKRQAGALQQAAQFAHIDHRRHARRYAARHRSFGRQPGLAEFGQRVAREQAGEQQAVGLQRAAHLDQCARHVVEGLQVEDAEHRVDSAPAGSPRSSLAEGSASRRPSPAALPSAAPRCASRLRRDQAGVFEAAVDEGQPLDQFLGDGAASGYWARPSACASAALAPAAPGRRGAGSRSSADQLALDQVIGRAVGGRDDAALVLRCVIGRAVEQGRDSRRPRRGSARPPHGPTASACNAA